ncbi:MAG: cytochrome c, partial [Albidovulum sp.]
MSKFLKSATLAMAIAGTTSPALAEKLGLGRPALPEEIAAWDKDISPDGTGLPVGSGDALVGEEVFAAKCAACHGDFAEGIDNWPKLAGGADTLDHDDPLKTAGSYWPHLSTAFDYVRRSMPYGNAGTLTDDEVYAIVAYILYSNDLVEDDFVLSNETFFDVDMPNAEGFFVDDRAETEYANWTGEPCMENCKADVKVTMRAMVLDVT